MIELKEKTLIGLLWSFIDNFAKYGLQFVIGIILARLLTPKEFGLIGIITVFISISNSIVDSGFSQALIRKNDATDKDYSTVFLYNLAFSVFVFLILFFSANYVSVFFGEPNLKLLLRVFSVNIILNSFGIVQRTQLIKNINFKAQTKITIISGLASGILAIWLAYIGFGVWSLIAKTTIFNLITVFLLRFYTDWKPILYFSRKSFKELFSFGSKMVAAGLIDTIYRNIYYVIIGKYYSSVDLGYYTRAEQFNNFPSSNLTTVIQRVSYPVLSKLQDDNETLKFGYKKTITLTMFVSFASMFWLTAVSESLILTLIGINWEQSIIYLQLLCFVGMLYPLHGLNLNILKVKGRSDLFLKLEIIKKILAVPIIIAGIYWGIKVMIIGMIINSIIAYYINSFWSGRLVSYSMREQLMDIVPSFLLSAFTASVVYVASLYLKFSPMANLMLLSVLWISILILICESTKFKPYKEIVGIVITYIKKIRYGKK